MEPYNIVYNSPSKNSWGSMVCGNGDISSDVWVDEEGNLQFYIGKTDSRDNISRLLKITRVTIQYTPSIFKDAKFYRQEFDLKTASFHVKTSQGDLRFWVDANSPQIIVEINSKRPVEAWVTSHVWRRHAFGNNDSRFPFKIMVDADSLVADRKNDILLFHHNLQTPLFDSTLKLFKISETEVKNPLKYRIFGAYITGENLQSISDSSLQTISPTTHLSIRATLLTSLDSNSKDWENEIIKIANNNESISNQQFFIKHKDYWARFWDKSFIEISSQNPKEVDTIYHLNRAYLYNRYMMNIAAKGEGPIQFNGSTWVVDTFDDTIRMGPNRKIFGRDADFRVWDELILWQNMRLPYWTFLQSGDFKAMHSLLDFYTDVVYPRMKDFTKNILGKKGVVFTESTMLWGTVDPSIYEWDRKEKSPDYFVNLWHQYHYICGLELVNLLLDYYAYVQDEPYLKNKILPIAKDLLTFYQDNYPLDENGKMKIFPARCIETFLDCTNPTPDIAGLRFVIPRLKKIAENINDEKLLKQCNDLFAVLPAIPIKKEKDGDVILPAQILGRQINVEQPDLYAVYPFRLYTIATPLLKTGQFTFEHPTVFPTNQNQTYMMPHIQMKNSKAYRDIFSWHQTGVQAAYLGLADYAKEILVRSAMANDKRFRFPSFYGPNYDYVPDGDHLAMINATLQNMILQSEGGTIYLLPGWPKEWNLKFKLYAFQNTLVEGEFVNGKIKSIHTTPANRKKDIKIME
ncbi:MAG: hypothetical protein JST58_18195 [Bacteroidetes bacterium]|nr:hypothetical protein [Bacteroidota bacterium]